MGEGKERERLPGASSRDPLGAAATGEPRDGLQDHERTLVHERTALRPLAIHAVIRAEGEEELERPLSSLAFSGLAAGLSMGLSFAVPGLLEASLPAGVSWAPLVVSLGYTVGFLVVTLGRQQLYTETTLTVVLPLLSAPTGRRLARTLQFWIIVLTANLLGALIFAAVVAHTAVFATAVKATLHEVGVAAFEGDWATLFVRGIFAGWLIALIIWMRPMARTAWIWVIVSLTYVVGLAGFPHIVAGSVETLYLVAQGDIAWSSWIVQWMVPTLLGNTIGGISLVAGLNHAQSVVGAGVDVRNDPRETPPAEGGESDDRFLP